MKKEDPNLPEYWLRGPVPDIPELLQPVAHALLQSLKEVKQYTQDFNPKLLNTNPAGRASVAFHLKHLTGVLDRMLTYAKAETLSEQQFDYLKNESLVAQDMRIDVYINAFEKKVDETLIYLKNIDVLKLTESRTVGRKKLPSTVLGLLFHAAEHSQRHVGQLLVTISVLNNIQLNN